MAPLQRQFEAIRARNTVATRRELPSGAVLIVLPDVPLPEGWSAPTTAIKFLAPVGYPFSAPDCFWADVGLRLKNGAMPQASNITPIPEVNEPHLWFSWHVQSWNANRDSLLSYIAVIKTRLGEIR